MARKRLVLERSAQLVFLAKPGRLAGGEQKAAHSFRKNHPVWACLYCAASSAMLKILAQDPGTAKATREVEQSSTCNCWCFRLVLRMASDVFDSPKIISFLAERLSAGVRVCLVTVTHVTGGAVRIPGAHMAVTENGESCGSLTGGCIEKAVVSEAVAAIRDAAPRQIAYGAGSPIIDIRLPCGGRIDLLFNPIHDAGSVNRLHGALAQRLPCTLSLPTVGTDIAIKGSGETGWLGQSFVVHYYPALRLILAGHGGPVETLVRLARAMGIACEVVSPDDGLVERMAALGTPALRLERLSQPPTLEFDQWTALVCFFHEHEWEASLIRQALGSPAFYIGAMGSASTHAARCASLLEMGTRRQELARIVAPIGLIPSSRDPETLALSTLAQVVDGYNRLIGVHSEPSVTERRQSIR